MAEKFKDLPTSGTALPLTLDNVFNVVKNVNSWRTLGQHIIYPNELDGIQRQYVSDEARLKAVVEDFLSGKRRYKQPSWRAVIWCLYWANEIQLAEHIRSFAEPVQDLTMTVKNVIGVMENVAVERRREVWSRWGIVPYPQLEEIYQKYFTEEQRIHACTDIYINCNPEPSWTHLCQGLYREKEMTAAKKAKTFIPQTDPTWTTENVIGVMEKVTDGGAMEVWWCLNDDDLLEDINSKCFTERELVHTCADIFVNCDPHSSWEPVADGLYRTLETAAVEEVRSYLSPRDLTLTTERLVELFASVDDDVFDSMDFMLLNTPFSKRNEFKMNYKNPAQRKEAYLDYYVHNNPLASWTKIADMLNTYNLPQQAAVVENTYIQVSERTRINFEAAMKEGILWIRNGNTFFLGPGGSGKTHTLHSLLEEDPPVIRDSTACAKKPIRAVAQFKVGVRGTARFIRITDDQYSEMLANSAEHFSAVPTIVAPTEASQTLDSKVVASLSLSSKVQVPESPSSPGAERVAKESSAQNQPPVAEFGLRRELQCLMQARSKTSELLDDKDLMDVKDSGGQPMFHEVLPVFVTNTMFGILTVKLNESLDSHPLVEYYISGRRIGEPFKSPFTHLQTFRHCLRVLQSTCDPDACPKIVFVGTHKDLEHECPDEDRKEKNRKLQSIIPPEMKDNIIYNGESLLFPINAKIPGNDDRKVMGDLRQLMIWKLQQLPKKRIPLRYFSLENAFQRLAKYQRKAILSIDECLKEATAYHFTRESLDDVLQYLHSLKLIMYYKNILPDVVFIDAQVLLDKITELVEYSIELRAKPRSQAVAAGSLEKFKTCGIVTTEILSQFTSGYVPGLFEEKHLILVFKKLLIVAEIGKGKFLMPCLLEEEKVQILFSSVAPALFFYFGRNGPKLGVYCFLLASLITEAKWELLVEDNCPVQLSRNRVRFAVPGNNPGCITITDSFSTFFHVSIEFPDTVTREKATEICEKVCPTIRETILTHIRKASHRLNYNNSIPEAAFLCSKHDDAIPPHPARISNTGLLTCTTHPKSIFSDLTDQHKIWFGKDFNLTGGCATSAQSSVGLDDKPSLSKLTTLRTSKGKRIKIIETVAPKWQKIGDLLDFDESGTRLELIKATHPSDPEACCRSMFQHWLKGNGVKPCSWRKLIELLEDSNFESLAKEVETILSEL